MHCGRECVIITAVDMNSRKNPERNTDTGYCSSAAEQVSDQRNRKYGGLIHDLQ